jgi:ferredoxin--NADP+ reductase
METGRLFDDIGLPLPNPSTDRFMLCGSPNMLGDLTTILKAKGFVEGSQSAPGHYVIEKAFVGN